MIIFLDRSKYPPAQAKPFFHSPLAQLVGRDHFTTQLRRLLTFMGTLRLLTVPQRQTLQPCCSTCYKSKLVMPA